MKPPRFSREWWLDSTMQIPETGCHVWNGFVCPQGYARTWYNGKGGILVHRIAYELAYGPVPEGMSVCHRCDVPSCCNPDHLFLGTHADNMRDMFKKRRARPQGKDWGDRKAQIIALIAENPKITRREIAAAIGLTYNYVSQICREEGIAVASAHRGRAPGWREGVAA